MKYRPAPFLLSLAFHALIIALCFPMLVDRKFAHRAIPIDFTLVREEKRQEVAADGPVHVSRPAAARAKGATKEPQQTHNPRVAPSESPRLAASGASAVGTVSTGQVETGGPVAVAAAPSGEGERRLDAGPGGARLARIEGPGATGAPAGGQDAWRDAIRSELRRTVEKNKVYPDRAKRMNWQGKVDLSFRVFEDGTIRDVRVAKSSGFQVLDDAARDLLKKLRLSYRPVEKMQLELAVEYRLQ
jgi:protein TonB